MRIPSPTSRTGKRARLSYWDIGLAVACPAAALFLRDAEIVYRSEWGVVGLYWALSASFAVIAFSAFRIQDGITPYFSTHDALDVVEAVVLAEFITFLVLFTITRLDGIPRSTPLIHAVLLATGLLPIRISVRLFSNKDVELPDYHGRHERMILIGANAFSSHFIKLLHSYAPQQQRVIAVLDEDAALTGQLVAGVRVLGTPQQL